MADKNNLSRTLAHNKLVRDKHQSKRSNPADSLRQRTESARKKRLDTKKVFSSPVDNLAIYSKTVMDPNAPQNDQDRDEVLTRVFEEKKEALTKVFRSVLCTQKNSKAIKEQFPDVAMAVSIIVAGFTSPVNLKDNSLNISLHDNILTGASSLRSIITKDIYDDIENYYEFTDTIPDIYSEAIAGSGSDPHLFISEAVMDDIINAEVLANASMESFQGMFDHNLSKLSSSLGILEKQTPKEVVTLEALQETPSMEKLAEYLLSDDYFRITDNVGVCRLGDYKEELKKTILRKTLRKGGRISTENLDKIKYTDLFRDPKVQGRGVPLREIRDKVEATRKPIGRAIYRKIPAQSVIPIYVPGSPSKHVGYIVLLDEDSMPLTGSISDTSFNKMNNSLHSNGGDAISQVYRDLVAGNQGRKGCDKSGELFDLHKQIIERQILEAFKASLYGDYVEIANVEEISFILLYRALSGQKTNALYVPKENIVYFALDHNHLGVGKTLLEDHYVTFSMRSLVRFASVMGYIRSSIDVTDVDVELDPRDPNAEESVEMLKKLVMDSRNSQFPLGILEPHDLTTWIQRMGLNFNFSNHPDLPNVAISYSKSNVGGNTQPDREYEEKLEEDTALGLLVSPETIRASYSPDFAYEAKLNNEFFNQRSRRLQKKASKDLSKFVGLIVYNDEVLRKKIRDHMNDSIELVKSTLEEDERALLEKDADSFFEMYLDRISDSLTAKLPEIPEANPDATRSEFDKYVEELDTILDILCNEDLYASNHAGKVSDVLLTWKANIRVAKIREWASKNNYRPEIFSVYGSDDDSIENLVSSMKSMYVGNNKQIIKLFDSLIDVKLATNQDLKRIISEGTAEGEEEEDLGY